MNKDNITSLEELEWQLRLTKERIRLSEDRLKEHWERESSLPTITSAVIRDATKTIQKTDWFNVAKNLLINYFIKKQ